MCETEHIQLIGLCTHHCGTTNKVTRGANCESECSRPEKILTGSPDKKIPLQRKANRGTMFTVH